MPSDARRRRRLQFAARQRPCIRAQAIEFASIAFRKGLARSNEGCVEIPPLRTGPAARRFCHKCAYGRKSVLTWFSGQTEAEALHAEESAIDLSYCFTIEEFLRRCKDH